MINSFPTQNQRFTIDGAVGRIEIAIEMPRTKPVQDIVFVMCRPSPIEQGTMDNKVVTTTCRAMQALGITTVRFNFRGVGQSDGVFANGVGEVDDAKAVLEWVKQHNPHKRMWLGGFSFGGFIAYQACGFPGVSQLLTIAPGITRFNMAGLAEPQIPWVVVQGGADEIIDPVAVQVWLEKHHATYTLKILPGIGHFFHGQLIVLRELLKEIYCVK